MRQNNMYGIIAALCASVIGAQSYFLLSLGDERAYLRGALYQALGLAEHANKLATHSEEVARRYEEELREVRAEIALGRIERRIRAVSPRAPHPRRTAVAIVTSATTHNLDPLWWAAQIEHESHYDPRAVSHAGARGLAQIMPGTARELNLEWRRAFDPEANLDAGARYMAALLRRHGTLNAALLRYVGGDPGYSRAIRVRYERGFKS